MPITPLCRYYNVPNAIKVYHHRNGEVYITHGDDFYAVHIIKQTTPYSEQFISRGRLDHISANEFFQVACRYLRDEIKWTEPTRQHSCKYNPKKSRACNPKNCPKKLGGAAYWEMFGANCMHRCKQR